jgi:hypothetical protein
MPSRDAWMGPVNMIAATGREGAPFGLGADLP